MTTTLTKAAAATYDESTVPSPNRHKGRLKPIRVIVVHDGETSEGRTAAEGMANWFAQLRSKASAHISVDNDSRVRSVADDDTAWAAPSANADGLQLEIAGRASQTPAQWADDYSEAALDNAAQVCARWAVKHNIPIRWLTNAQLADGYSRGFTYHFQCTQVFGGTHTDPGPNFPYKAFLARVKSYIDGTGPKAPAKPNLQAKLEVDGLAGPLTFAKARSIVNASADVYLVKYLQGRLNAAGFRGLNGHPLVVDGRGLFSNALQATPTSHTQHALLSALGNPRNDGRFDHPSEGVKAWQRALNAGRLW